MLVTVTVVKKEFWNFDEVDVGIDGMKLLESKCEQLKYGQITNDEFYDWLKGNYSDLRYSEKLDSFDFNYCLI
jgi:hypothetical protein